MADLYVEGLYEIIPLKEFRNTDKVKFHILPTEKISKIDAIDRVEHSKGAISPGRVGDVERPWYCHKAQTDNLLVFKGKRITELYTPKHGKIETFTVTPEYIEKDGNIYFEGPAILSWPPFVFHRVTTSDEGSLSINIAVHLDGFSLKDNFDIYSVDIQTGQSIVIRQGHLDQQY
ncbi:hypothetical protein MCHI_000936 [Candidatus Magnetoovum chiemensis]|nr:hypothetical protein MCHI_000936 [Candidatus Magnetoovum chiemensis]